MHRTQSDEKEEKVTRRRYRSVYPFRTLFFILKLNLSRTVMDLALLSNSTRQSLTFLAWRHCFLIVSTNHGLGSLE
jgi:hypothetical protein